LTTTLSLKSHTYFKNHGSYFFKQEEYKNLRIYIKLREGGVKLRATDTLLYIIRGEGNDLKYNKLQKTQYLLQTNE
jgi:hypothetical protein